MTTKLNADQVQEIRRLIAGGKVHRRKIAARFGVSTQAVNFIAWGRSWSSLPLPEGITEENFYVRRPRGRKAEVNVCVSRVTHSALRKIATASNKTLDDVVREAIAALLKQKDGVAS